MMGRVSKLFDENGRIRTSFGGLSQEIHNDSQESQDSQDPQDFQKINKGLAMMSTPGGADDTAGHCLLLEKETEELPDPSLPLKDFVSKAWVYSIRKYEEAEASGRHMTRSFGFTRCCRRHPKLVGLTAEEAAKAVPWRFTGADEDDRMTFELEWDAVGLPAGMTLLAWAALLAKEHPLIVPDKRDNVRYNRFISLMGNLQYIRGQRFIFASTRDVAKLLGCSQPRASTYFQYAIRSGYLKVAQRHPNRARKATEYCFAVERFPLLQERIEQREGIQEA